PPVPFTQFIQQPKFNTVCVDGRLSIPDGGTMLIDGGMIEHERQWEDNAPVLSKVPYGNRLFKKTGTTKEVGRLLGLVTPRVIIASEECETPACVKACCGACATCQAGKRCCDCCGKGCCKGEGGVQVASAPPTKVADKADFQRQRFEGLKLQREA